MSQEKSHLRVAGVPEAYNDPFIRADFTSHGLDSPVFCPYPGGSGSMLKAVVAGEVDVAFALTDCIVAAIENGSPVRLAAPLVKTPLTWAVVVAPGRFGSITELSSATWGVSRMGSGSHVMVQTLAKQKHWSTPNFKICSNFEGLRSALTDRTIDAFLWEHFTTKPYSDNGEVSIIDGVPTPWGCFSVVVRENCPRLEEVRKVVDVFLATGKEFLADETSAEAISQKHRMKVTDAKAWIAGVRYAEPGERMVAEDSLEFTRKTLLDAGVIKTYQCVGGIAAYHARGAARAVVELDSCSLTKNLL